MSESFTTPEGDVEYYETLEPSAPVESDTSAESAAVDLGADEPTDIAGMTRLFVNLGRRSGMRADEFTEYLQSSGQLESTQIGQVLVRDRHTFISVATEVAEPLIERISGKPYRERTLRLELARSKGRDTRVG